MNKAHRSRPREERFYAVRSLDGAVLEDHKGILSGHFATQGAAEAIATFLNAMMDMPFTEIGTPVTPGMGPSPSFGKERVAFFVARALGLKWMPIEQTAAEGEARKLLADIDADPAKRGEG